MTHADLKRGFQDQLVEAYASAKQGMAVMWAGIVSLLAIDIYSIVKQDSWKALLKFPNPKRMFQMKFLPSAIAIIGGAGWALSQASKAKGIQREKETLSHSISEVETKPPVVETEKTGDHWQAKIDSEPKTATHGK